MIIACIQLERLARQVTDDVVNLLFWLAYAAAALLVFDWVYFGL